MNSILLFVMSPGEGARRAFSLAPSDAERVGVRGFH